MGDRGNMKVPARHKGERGVATILVLGVLMFFLIFFIVIAIDFAYVYVARGQIQNAADAAALAGAAKLTVSGDPVQATARQEAIKFAAKNTAAGDIVQLITDNTNVLSASNDITVGFWNGTAYERGHPPYNALEVRARRTSDSPGGPVGLFFGKIVGWGVMDVAQVAIASLPPRPTSAMSICIRTCELQIPAGGLVFFFRDAELKEVAKQVAKQICKGLSGNAKSTCEGQVQAEIEAQGEYVLAFTEFSCEKSTEFGPDSPMAQYIKGEPAPNVCNKCIRTNKGQANQVIGLLKQKYNEKKDEDGKWRVIAPVAKEAAPNFLCPNCGSFASTTDACPTESQGSSQEPYLIERYAELFISGVTLPSESPGDFNFIYNGVSYPITNLTGPTVRIADIRCVDCPADELTGEKAQLVR